MRDFEWMIRRGWPPAYLDSLEIDEFRFHLENAVAAAKEEAEAMNQASRR